MDLKSATVFISALLSAYDNTDNDDIRCSNLCDIDTNPCGIGPLKNSRMLLSKNMEIIRSREITAEPTLIYEGELSNMKFLLFA